MKLELTSLKKAIYSLDEALVEYSKNINNKFIRDACIQRFEYTYDLSHKGCELLVFIKNHIEAIVIKSNKPLDQQLKKPFFYLETSKNTEDLYNLLKNHYKNSKKISICKKFMLFLLCNLC